MSIATCGNCWNSEEGICIHAGEVNCSCQACKFYVARSYNLCGQVNCPHYDKCVNDFNAA